METAVTSDSIEAAPLGARDALDYAWNLATAGYLGGICLNEEPLARLMLETEGPTAAEGEKLNDRELAARLRQLARTRRPRPEPVACSDPHAAENLAQVADALGLGQVERDVIHFLLVSEQSWELHSLLSEIRCRSIGVAVRILAAAIGRPGSEVERALDAPGRLIAGGFVTPDHYCYDFTDAFALDRRLRELASAPSLDAASVLDRFLPRAPAASLGLDDYPHVAEAARRAARLLAAALDRRAAGVNVLIFGPTGSGKSELGRVLAREARAALFVAGKEDDQGLSPDSRERLEALRLGHRVLTGCRALVVFDELEDLFVRDNLTRATVADNRDTARMSKLWFNQLLESAPIPTIWMSNDVSAMDPAFLRRFAVALELPWPSPSQRQRLWRRHLGADLRLSDADLDDLAAKYPVSPGQIETATRSARLLDQPQQGLRQTLEELLAPIAALVGARPDGCARLAGQDYDPALASTRTDLGALTDRVAGFCEGDGPGLSFCLYGPPGTGKSEYVRYLARRLDRPLVVRRASDLLSMWVGGTEKQIAAAFREARDARGVLLLDEVDSLLRDRRRAVHGWEATQVNELLQQLEVFPGVVACTTNLFEDLDQAALRRFTFRVPFEFLAPDKARLLLRRLLGELGARPDPAELAAADRAVARLTKLAPGDFAVVARRLRLAVPAPGAAPDVAAIVRELEDELAVKEGGRGHPPGFRA